jgi:hypothetical protein
MRVLRAASNPLGIARAPEMPLGAPDSGDGGVVLGDSSGGAAWHSLALLGSGTRSSSVHDLAPEVTRQRLLVEGYYTIDVDEQRVDDYLQGVAAHLGLRTCGRPAIFAPAGQGRDKNQGFDAFLPLIDPGISGYVWTGPRFAAAILCTCNSSTSAPPSSTRRTSSNSTSSRDTLSRHRDPRLCIRESSDPR